MRNRSLAPWRVRSLPTTRPNHPFIEWSRDIDRFLNELSPMRSLSNPQGLEGFSPPVNISDEDEVIRITAELPGIDEGDLDLTIQKDLLTIKGEKKLELEEHKGDYSRIERRHGSFCRTIKIPSEELELENVEAHFANGVLTITLPKREEEVEISKRITVKSG